MSTGSRIAQLRRARGLTQAQLASAAGVSASTIAMYETGRRTPDPEQLDKLAAALGVPPDQLKSGPAGFEEAAEVPAPAAPVAAEPGRNSPSQEGPAEQPGAAYPAIPLDRFEARLILFLRLNPQARAFMEAYLAADDRRRQQIHKTWRLIHELQP
ncbi:helix-turn-helix domain-containing protein [Alicyclobacillus macrosporangiidus]|uniref:helix-turn-helix domain-containing protein n=1 Tax=Alicyclobacillus macrosporangiidus TaxID=392015 RepID=UPI000558D27B|nr:helix-turn-helix transcriptional regulator [Alicyclobacillus macrosporangiidus]